MNGEILIREASENDLGELFRLYRQLESPDTPLTPERLAATFRRAISHQGLRVFVAIERGDTTVGIAGTFILAILPVLGDRCRPVAIVEDVVVDASRRGRGIGKVMMEFAMREARAADCYKLMLSSNISRTEAHRFYESLGFRRHGISFVTSL